MKVRYNGKSQTLAHKGAGAEGRYGIDGSFYLFNREQWIEVNNPADIEFYRNVSRVEDSDFEIEKPEAVADKIKGMAEKTVQTIKEAVVGKPAEPEPEPMKEPAKGKGALRLLDLRKRK